MNALADRFEVTNTILRFMRALDIQDWELCRACFADQLETDYSDLRGEPPSTVDADEFVAKRKNGLAGLKTLHVSTNHLVTVNGDEAECISNAVIYRFSADDFFHTYCMYIHRLHRTASGWKIHAVKQTVVANTGNPQVHGALR